jgi:hypothetical protein
LDFRIRSFEPSDVDACRQLELIADPRPLDTQTWRAGVKLAGRDVRL